MFFNDEGSPLFSGDPSVRGCILEGFSLILCQCDIIQEEF